MEGKRATYGFGLLASGYLWACVAVFAALRLSGAAVNHFLYSAVADVFGPAREIATLLGAVVYFAYAFVALRNPRSLNAKAITVLCVAAFGLFGACLAAANAFAAPALFVLALMLRTMASASLVVLFGFCLLRLDSLVHVAAVIAFGFLFNYLCTPAMRILASPVTAIAFMVAAGVLCSLFCGHFAREGMDRVRLSESAGDMELDDPWSFVQPSHALFWCVLLFSTATGFALTLGEVGNAPAQITIEGFAIVLVALYLVFVHDEKQEDTLFSFAVLLVAAGLLVAPLTIQMDVISVAPNTLIRFGGDCFTVLLWLVIAGVGKRNLFGMLPVLGFAQAYGSVGTTLGAMVGHATNGYIADNTMAAAAVCLGIAFVFFAFLWAGFRTFSFTETINGVQKLSVADVESGAAADGAASEEGGEVGAAADSASVQPPPDAIAQCCAELAAEHGLTPRETEIFQMLARGRNGRFIMEHYVISRNTTKSHIKHIYAKLGVHSHQELIDLVQ